MQSVSQLLFKQALAISAADLEFFDLYIFKYKYSEKCHCDQDWKQNTLNLVTSVRK